MYLVEERRGAKVAPAAADGAQGAIGAATLEASQAQNQKIIGKNLWGEKRYVEHSE